MFPLIVGYTELKKRLIRKVHCACRRDTCIRDEPLVQCCPKTPQMVQNVMLSAWMYCRDRITISQCFFQIKLGQLGTRLPPSAILTEKTRYRIMTIHKEPFLCFIEYIVTCQGSGVSIKSHRLLDGQELPQHFSPLKRWTIPDYKGASNLHVLGLSSGKCPNLRRHQT